MDEKGKTKSSFKKGITYLIAAHDGKRLLKVILLLEEKSNFFQNIRETNKYLLQEAEIHYSEGIYFVVNSTENLNQLYNDTHSTKLIESINEIAGLTIKYTGAPKFVFLNESCNEEGSKQQ